MRKLFLLTVLLSGCATPALKPVSPDQVPDQPSENVQRVASLSVADIRALARVYDDARALLLRQMEAGNEECGDSDRVVGVTVWEPDASGMRYVVVAYRPDFCPESVVPSFVHRDLAYLLTPDGKLLGPRVRGR
ncbi:hypothetical protein [Myxococcus sp. CA040A]|uniref:hypothetical protein n=1 Tax=Myxococcus sp. CA040A TaxID=2741738 RepID=UPI00157B7B9D|nr:hypothetical protein [Myxococcus sp. CA040A]NTX09051.1 hypothetical protein [Myxococcus sp. CA040A]